MALATDRGTRWTKRALFTDVKPGGGILTYALAGCGTVDMAGAPSQFGRRGVSSLQPAGPRGRVAQPSASTALQAATGWNRTSELPSLKDLAPLDPRDDDWAVPSSLVAGPTEAAARPGLMTILFSPNGRIGRTDYWVFSIASAVCAVLAILAAGVSLPPIPALAVATPIAVISIRIRMCLGRKRWHDRGKASAWILISLVPFVGWAWTFVECGLLPGTPGPNRYGPSPT